MMFKSLIGRHFDQCALRSRSEFAAVIRELPQCFADVEQRKGGCVRFSLKEKIEKNL